MRDSSVSSTSFITSSKLALSSRATTCVRGIMISFTSMSVKASTELRSCSLVSSSDPCLLPCSIRYSSSCEVTDSAPGSPMPTRRASPRGICTNSQANGHSSQKNSAMSGISASVAPVACRLAKVLGVISPKMSSTTVVTPVMITRLLSRPRSCAITAVSEPSPTLTSVLPSRSVERMRSGCRFHSLSSAPRQPPVSIRCCTRASPSAVSAVSEAEKNAASRSPTRRLTHCQVGTTVGGVLQAGSRPVRQAATAVSRPAGRLPLPVVPDQIRRREEEGDLGARVLGRVGAVHAVRLDAPGEQLADGALGGAGGIGRAHHLAVARHRVLALQHLHDDRAAGHVLHQALEERPLPVDGVEALRLLLRELQHLHGHRLEARLLELRQDLADDAGLQGVRLEDAEGSLDGHVRSCEGRRF